MLLLAAFTAVGLAALLPAYLWEMAQGHHIHTHAGSLAALAYVGIFPSFIGYIFYNRGVAEVGASRASLFIHLMPVLAPCSLPSSSENSRSTFTTSASA